jgi:hypothetical protein
MEQWCNKTDIEEAIVVPWAPEKEDPSPRRFLRRADSAGPVSPSMYKAESWQRAVTLDKSTPQCRISEIRVWSYNPLLRLRYHRQVKLAVKT